MADAPDGCARQGRKALCGALSVTALTVLISTATAKDAVPTEPSIVEIQKGLAAGRFDVRTLERHYETRIANLDRSGPKLNSIIELNPEAARLAGTLEATPDRKLPLFGVPILLKDNIDTSDAMQTTAGSLALVGSKPAR